MSFPRAACWRGDLFGGLSAGSSRQPAFQARTSRRFWDGAGSFLASPSSLLLAVPAPPQTTACALINPCRLSCPLLLSSLSFSFSVFHIVAHRCDSRTFSATRRNSFTHAILHHLFSLYLSICLFIKVTPALVLRLHEAGQPSSLPPRNPAEQQYSPPGLPV